MELDRTKIVIRERSWSDLVDLTLVVLRDYWNPVLFWGTVGALPFFLLNMLVLKPLLDFETILIGNEMNSNEELLYTRYLFHSITLVFLEAPFAMQGLTYFLGQAVFVERPHWREVVKSVRSSFGNCVLILGVLRGGLLGLPLVLAIPRDSALEPFIEIFLIGCVLLVLGTAIRVFRPFAPEMLMLERSPLRKPKNGVGVRYGTRSFTLHHPLSSELVGRALVMAFVFSALLVSLTLAERFVVGVLFGHWSIGWWDNWILLPINLWFLAMVATIFRFLSYLDARIRLEGWEVELRLKAEAIRLEVGT